MEEVAPFREEINRVNFTSRQHCPFSTYEYIDHYVRHNEYFSDGQYREIWFLTAFEDGRLIGYLPLRRTFERVLGKPRPRLDFLVTHETDRPHLVALPEKEQECVAAFYEELLRRKDKWDFLEFKDQDAQSSLFPLPPPVDFSSFWPRRFENSPNATVAVRHATLAEYFATLSSSTKSNVRRHIKMLFSAGSVHYVSSSHPALLPELFEAYLSIEPRSWKVEGGAAISRHPERIAHFRHLLSESQPIRTTIQLVYLNRLPIVGSINAAFGRTLFLLETAYDADFSQLGPGSLMVLLAMRQGIEERFHQCNMLTNFGYFKSKWGAEMTPTQSVQLFRVGSRHFYKAVVGDFLRRVRPPAPGAEAKGPARRKQEETPTTSSFAAKRARASAQLSPDALDRLGQRAVDMGGEYLRPEKLAEVLPVPAPTSAPRTAPAAQKKAKAL
jgi:hypothetical protein